jgi:hypothetical protein
VKVSHEANQRTPGEEAFKRSTIRRTSIQSTIRMGSRVGPTSGPPALCNSVGNCGSRRGLTGGTTGQV